MDQGQSRKLIELVIWDRFNESNVTADNEVGGSQLEKIKIALDETGVEIIPETSSEQLEGQTVVQIPLHLVDRQRKQSEQKKVEGRSQRWEQQNLPPIEVGLQLGHPEQVEPPEKEKAIVEHGGTQTESKELAHAEVQTHAPNDLVSHSTTSSQTDLDCSHPKEDQVNTRSVTETVTSETQTPTVERGEQSNQTEEKSLLDQEVQTANEDFLTEETLITEGVVAGQPTQGSRPLQERPPTLPGSSIEEPHIEQDFLRTRTVSPQNLKVQDDVVARVLLEHVGTVFPSVNPRLRSGVNYLDLSRLGDEGETPASDEIWLAVDGSGCHSEDDPIEEDKFLTTDDTETYSIATDKLSTAATMAGYGNNTGPTLLQAPSSANLLSEQELADLGGCESFDAEAEATARLQGVLASELIPLHTTVQSTDKNVVNLTSKFGNMENVLGTLCTTIERLQSQVPKNTDGSEDIQIKKVTNAGQRVVTPPSRSSPNGGGIRGTDVRLLDQLVARIEHLSSDVANMDASRQLREDNLLLRKELQTYRERELAMMTRLESLEKRLNDFQVRPSSHHRRHQRSRRSSIASSRGTPELPPIETRSRSVDSPKEKPEKAQQEEKLEPLSNANNEEPTRQSTPPKDKTSLDKIVKQPLLPKSKTTKNGVPKLPRRTSNSSSNSSQGSGNEELPENIKAIKKRQPITPKLDNDYLQTEIQIQRSDNSILRQDLQVQKLREQQLYARNKELQEKLIEATSPRPHSRDERTPPTGQEKSEVNINVDFVTEDGGGPKAVFETKKEAKTGKKTPPSRDSSKERGKPAPLKKDLSKDKIAVPKNKKKSTSSSSGSSAEGERSKIKEESEANVTAEKEKPDKKVSLANDAKNGVPKTKPTANGKAKKQTNGKTTNGKKSSPKGSSSSEDLVKKEQLIDDEEWKVTITSKHELETHSDDPNKVVIVKPKPVEEVKEEVKEVAKKAVKAKKAKKLDKVKDPRHDPIPKPSMFPAARPPRGYVPPCALPNASPGVTAAITGSYGPMGYGGGDGLLMTPGRSGYRSGRASSIDSDSGEVISMMIKQEPRDSLVDAVPPRIHPPVLPRTPSRTPAPPPICQVSYDSVYDDPYYSMSYY